MNLAFAARSTRPSKRPQKPPEPASTMRGAPSPYFDMPSDPTATPAYRYAQLSRGQCEAELKARHVRFRRDFARGVVAPVRLTGPVNGILFRGEGTDEERARSPHEIVDCRLVLALYDCAKVLRAHDIVEVRHYSMYRLPEPSWPRGQPATRHMGAVAIDTGLFIKKDGQILDVLKHFHGRIGAKTCGPDAGPRPPTKEALELRSLLCEIVEQRLFNVVLTPNYNEPHRNHFHLEVTPGKKWFLVH